MTLPAKNPKEYLEINPTAPFPVIEGEPQHVAELEAILVQHGIPCQRTPPARPGWEAVQLPAAALEQAQELLDGYKAAKGS